jgi:hypothetical protein
MVVGVQTQRVIRNASSMCNVSDILHLHHFDRRVIDAWTEMFAAPDATQAVIYSMYRIGKMVALQHITGPVATPCCAGKPKKTIVERLCGLKHADVSELVI